MLLDMIGHRVVICELIGINFQQYNIRDEPFYPQQDEINAGVILLNEYIQYMNAERLLYRFDGSCTIGASIVPQLNPLGGQATPLHQS